MRSHDFRTTNTYKAQHTNEALIHDTHFTHVTYILRFERHRHCTYSGPQRQVNNKSIKVNAESTAGQPQVNSKSTQTNLNEVYVAMTLVDLELTWSGHGSDRWLTWADLGRHGVDLALTLPRCVILTLTWL